MAQIADDVVLMTWEEKGGKVTSLKMRTLPAVCFKYMERRRNQ